jgi:hypothetical protein
MRNGARQQAGPLASGSAVPTPTVTKLSIQRVSSRTRATARALEAMVHDAGFAEVDVPAAGCVPLPRRELRVVAVAGRP